MTRLPITIAAAILSTFAAASGSSAALTGGNSDTPMAPPPADGAIEIAANYIYRLRNASSSNVWVKFLGSGPGFPAVVLVPAGIGDWQVPIPIPYPNIKVQTRKSGGVWSASKTLKWKPGPITLPSF